MSKRDLFHKLNSSLTGEEPCANDPEELHMSDHADRYMSEQQAQELCAGCPIIELCREYAHEAQEPYGVWGGETPRARGIDRKIRYAPSARQ